MNLKALHVWEKKRRRTRKKGAGAEGQGACVKYRRGDTARVYM